MTIPTILNIKESITTAFDRLTEQLGTDAEQWLTQAHTVRLFAGDDTDVTATFARLFDLSLAPGVWLFSTVGPDDRRVLTLVVGGPLALRLAPQEDGTVSVLPTFLARTLDEASRWQRVCGRGLDFAAISACVNRFILTRVRLDGPAQ
jgi:hypothetical protein